MGFWEFSFLALSSLFVIVDPLAAVPAFLAMTPKDTPEVRIRMARLACWVAAGILVLFAVLGKWIFRVLGITLPAFQMASSLVLILIAIDMLQAKRSPVQETKEETSEGAEKDDIAITPLAVPMLAGPGAISTAVVLFSQAKDWRQGGVVIGSILAVCLASFFIFRFFACGIVRLNPIFLKIATRLMGLLLAAVAVQFFLNAMAVEWKKPVVPVPEKQMELAPDSDSGAV